MKDTSPWMLEIINLHFEINQIYVVIMMTGKVEWMNLQFNTVRYRNIYINRNEANVKVYFH